MRDVDECRPYVLHMRAEHKHLNEALRRIQRMIDGADDTSHAERTGRVIEGLDGLREELARHFAGEESGGCLEEAVCRCPSLSPEATRLEAEHPALLSTLEQIIQRARETAPSGRLAVELAAQFGDFAGRLRAHEASENRVLRQAFGTSFGFDEDEI